MMMIITATRTVRFLEMQIGATVLSSGADNDDDDDHDNNTIFIIHPVIISTSFRGKRRVSRRFAVLRLSFSMGRGRGAVMSWTW